VAPELLTGQQEAELSFRGAVGELDPSAGPFLVVDIGGGSTEFAVGSETHGDPPRPEELSATLQVIETYLEDVARELPQVHDVRRLVGLAGTVTTVAAVELGLERYDRDRIHHFELSKAAAEDVFRTLATESRTDRLANPGLEPERADVIVGGCCILVRIMRFFGFESCLVSEADILDGLVASLR
jgi:exopolyphosphatase/guanosine-5'-triphosphate,3'-diphosphate pyrophosphatase